MKFKFTDLKKATNELNGVEGLLEEKISLAVTRKKNELVEDFCNAIESINEAGHIDKISDFVFNFYNDNFTEEEIEDEAIEEKSDEQNEVKNEIEENEMENKVVEIDKEVVSEEAVVQEDKKPKTKKEKPKKKDKQSIGVIGTILEVIKTKGPIDKEEIHKILVKEFPERNAEAMKKTLNVQIGGKKRPLRIEKDKKIELVISDDKKFSLKG